MSDRTLVGTPVRVVLDGNEFEPTGDSDPGDGKGRYETSVEVTAGRTFFKKVVQDYNVEGFTCRVTGNQVELLKEFSERMEIFPMSYTNRAGETYKAQGMISYSQRKAQTGVVDLVLLPNEDGWVLF